MTTKVAAAACAGTALWLSIGRLTVTDAATAHRIGFLPPLWLLPVFIVGTFAILAGLRLRSISCVPLFLSAAVLLPWLPVPVPDAFLAITGPALLFVWAAVAAAFLALQARPEKWWARLRDPRVATVAAGLLALCVFLLVWRGQRLPPTGDEPHYLLTAQSLLRDGDVKVENNYRQRDYLRYYGGMLTPHYSQRGVDGELYPGHGVGLATLLAPVFALGGYRAVAIWIAGLVAIGTALVWRAAFALTGDAGAAWFGWAVVSMTAPIAVYGSLIYPDPLAGVVFAACTLAAVLADARGTQRAAWPLAGSIALGISIGLLAWLHIRLAMPAGLFMIVLAARTLMFKERRWTHTIAIAAPFAVCVAGFMTFSWLTYGTLNPASSVGDRSSLLVERIPVGLLSLMTDQEFGLLPSAPIHLVSFAALAAVCVRKKRLGVDLLLIVMPYLLTLSAWSIWWAGACPPARFLVPMIFPLGVAAADLWSRQTARGRSVSAAMLAGSVMIAAAFAWGGDGALGYNDAVGRARWLQWASPLVDLTRAAPSFFRAGSLTPTSQTIADLLWPTTIWLLTAIAAWLLFTAADKRRGWTPQTKVLALSICAVAVFTIAVTASWAAVGGIHLTPMRSQLEALSASHERVRPVALQFAPWTFGRSRDLVSRLAITTPAGAPLRPDTLLRLDDVPAGNYALRIDHGSRPTGELKLLIGGAALPIERWTVSEASSPYAFHLATNVAALSVVGDDAATRSLAGIALVPSGGDAAAPLSLRARSAVRYGTLVVYALDDRVSLEEGGFWILGERRPDVVVSAPGAVKAIDITVRNRPVANTIRVRSGRWYAERMLQPDEAWQVRIPLPEPARDVVVGFDVERGVRPIDVDGGSRDRRLLGCWIELR